MTMIQVDAELASRYPRILGLGSVNNLYSGLIQSQAVLICYMKGE